MKRKIESDEEELPLLARKKSKKATSQKSKKKKRKYDDDDSDAEAEDTQVKSYTGIQVIFDIIFFINCRIVCFIPRFSCRNQRRKIQRWKQKVTVQERRSKRSSKKFGNGMDTQRFPRGCHVIAVSLIFILLFLQILMWNSLCIRRTMSSRGIRFLGIKIGFKVPRKRIFLLDHRADVNLRKATSNRSVCSLGTKIYKLFKNRISYVAS